MGNSSAKVEAKPVTTEKKLKPCCACPETKRVRDEWYVTYFVNLQKSLFFS